MVTAGHRRSPARTKLRRCVYSSDAHLRRLPRAVCRVLEGCGLCHRTDVQRFGAAMYERVHREHRLQCAHAVLCSERTTRVRCVPKRRGLHGLGQTDLQSRRAMRRMRRRQGLRECRKALLLRHRRLRRVLLRYRLRDGGKVHDYDERMPAPAGQLQNERRVRWQHAGMQRRDTPMRRMHRQRRLRRPDAHLRHEFPHVQRSMLPRFGLQRPDARLRQRQLRRLRPRLGLQ